MEEEVYVEIPLGYDYTSGRNKVCKLKNTLYRLKQSPHARLGRFTKAVVSLEYGRSQGDHTLFFKHLQVGKFTILPIFVVDIIISGDDLFEKQLLKERLT